MANHGGTALIVKTHAFGDALLCTPAVKTLINSEIGTYWVLTGPSAAEVWERIPGIERVFVAPVPQTGMSGCLKLLKWSLRHWKELKEVDRSFVFQGSAAIRRWVRYLTGAQMRSGGEYPLGRWEEVFPMKGTDYAGLSYARIAGVLPENYRPVFSIKDEEFDWVDKLVDDARFFSIAPGGGKNPRDDVIEKRWPPDRYAEIADRIDRMGIRVVLLGNEDDCEAAEEVCRNTSAPVLDMTGKTTWGQTAALLQRCCGFLGSDTGTAHLATAMEVPSVVIFGPTSYEALYAQGHVIPVFADISCSPCYSNTIFPGCVRDQAICMEAVTIDETWFSIQKVLNENIRR